MSPSLEVLSVLSTKHVGLGLTKFKFIYMTGKTAFDPESKSDRLRYYLTLAGLRGCRWPQSRHAARLAALAPS